MSNFSSVSNWWQKLANENRRNVTVIVKMNEVNSWQKQTTGKSHDVALCKAVVSFVGGWACHDAVSWPGTRLWHWTAFILFWWSVSSRCSQDCSFVLWIPWLLSECMINSFYVYQELILVMLIMLSNGRQKMENLSDPHVTSVYKDM